MKRFLEIGETINNVYVHETLDKKGCKVEYIIINNRWRLFHRNNNKRPFQKKKLKSCKNEICRLARKKHETGITDYERNRKRRTETIHSRGN